MDRKVDHITPTPPLSSFDLGRNWSGGQTQGDPTNWQHNPGYTFDAMGNRLTKQDSVTGAENYGYNAANMLTGRNGTNNCTNDLDGNTLTGGGRTNTWDSENRLAQCVYTSNGNTTTSQYTYGADGLRRRSAITTAGVTTTTDCVLDNSMFVRELRTNAQTQTVYNYATYLVGPRGPEYRRDDVSTGTPVRWYVYDGLGSVLAEVDPNGNVTASRKYDVYGGVRSSTGTSTSKHKFVGALGHPSDDESGLIYMRARYMDSQTGRFASEDPELKGSNWFNYCGNNPVNFRDATGESPFGALAILCDFLLIVLGFADDHNVLPPFWSKMFNTMDNLTGAAANFVALMEELAKVTTIGGSTDKGGSYSKVYIGLYGSMAAVMSCFFVYDFICMLIMGPDGWDKPGWDQPPAGPGHQLN